jgi:hypothetical protein
MPKYINTTNRPITISEGITSRVVQINETIDSEYILSATTDLTQTDEAPYFNPVNSVDKLSGPGVVEVDLLNTRVIKIIAKSDLDLHINSMSNTPPMHIVMGEIITIGNSKQIYRLYLSGASVVIQLVDNYFK